MQGISTRAAKYFNADGLLHTLGLRFVFSLATCSKRKPENHPPNTEKSSFQEEVYRPIPEDKALHF
ncbi:MAG TPA: hypothetical protein DCR93_10475 [Cytophagales bacterium]|nr:hypothetical protein [Cytophagales bacterium]HAP59897.1 hypothetical protein [Cytophagales bacterium]